MARKYLQGLFQAETCTYEGMAAVVDGANAQQFQHFCSNSPWDDDAVITQIAQDADVLLGGSPDSCLIIDESSFAKQGNHSVGVARQWCGRLGKVENCQVAVFAVLSNGQHHTLVDRRLYLPKEWADDRKRCEDAGVPVAARKLVSKSAHALDMIRTARARGMRFQWVAVDGGYGKEPDFLRSLDDEGTIFMADVHRDQRVWTDEPGLHVPTRPTKRGRPPTKRRASAKPVTVEVLVKSLRPSDWTRCVLRDSTRGPLQVDVFSRRIWVWNGEEKEARCWHLVVRREVGSPKTIKYSLSNAPADTPRLRLAQMQGHRYWVERTFEDAKGNCGLADSRATGWRAWHHHITMVMLAMLFIAEQRVAYHEEIELLTPRDIVEILSETLPRKHFDRQWLINQIAERHKKRNSSIESRFKNSTSGDPTRTSQ